MRVSNIQTNLYMNKQVFSGRKNNDNNRRISVSDITVPMVIAAMSLVSGVNSCTKDDIFERDKSNTQKDSLEVFDSTDYNPPYDIEVDTTYNEIIHDIIVFNS